MRGEQAGAAGLGACADAEARRLLAAAFETVPARPGLAGLTDGPIAAAGQHGTAAAASDVVGLVRKRAARARRRRVLVPAGAVALAAAVAGGVTAGALANGGAASPTALQAVTAAMIKTSAQSFTFRETSAPVLSNGSIVNLRLDRSGEFNPVNGTGEQQINSLGGDVIQYRLIGRYMYVRNGTLTDGKPWERWLSGGGYMSAAGIALGGGFAPINPADLLTQLEGVSSVHDEGPVSGFGWTGTSYGFTVNLPKAFAGMTMSGTVSVDSSGRVRELATVTRAQTRRGVDTSTDIMTFGDFGIALSVTAPPANQVYIGG